MEHITDIMINNGRNDSGVNRKTIPIKIRDV
jgi:hypothetical protein